MQYSSNANSTVLDTKTTKIKYPEAKIIVLNDDFNTFEHVANSLETIIPGMSRKNHGNTPSKIVKVRQKFGDDLLSRRSSIISN